MSRGHRIKVEKHIYRDAYGLSAIVQVGVTQREKRFRPGTTLKEIRLWVGRTRAELADAQPKTKRGLLAHDAERYYRRIEGVLAGWREVRSMIRAWVTLYGTWPWPAT